MTAHIDLLEEAIAAVHASTKAVELALANLDRSVLVEINVRGDQFGRDQIAAILQSDARRGGDDGGPAK